MFPASFQILSRPRQGQEPFFPILQGTDKVIRHLKKLLIIGEGGPGYLDTGGVCLLGWAFCLCRLEGHPQWSQAEHACAWEQPACARNQVTWVQIPAWLLPLLSHLSVKLGFQSLSPRAKNTWSQRTFSPCRLQAKQLHRVKDCLRRPCP